jgi:CheY-like chemotaxis protein/HPt (histidine-containing phosphotransfer) domain-containing protein
MRHLFRAFSQADSSTTRKYGGTGLGLVISARLAQLMGGDTWAVSEAGRGSTFYFTIDTEAVAPRAATLPRLAPVPEFAGRRVLIVDDNAASRLLLERLCRRWGLDATTAASGEAALRHMQNEAEFDCALIDAHMPMQDGIGLARALRDLRPGAGPALVLMSAGGARQQAALAEAGFAARLAKPIRHVALFDCLAGLFGVARASAQTEAGEAAEGPAHGRAPAATQPLRILVAEDSPINQKLALRVLGKLGHVADGAANGAEVLALLRRARYDIVFMDLQMPELDGLETARRVVAEWSPSDRPRMIAMTANALPGTREACLAAGMDDYIAKPVLRGELERAIAQWGGHATAGGAGTDGRLIDTRTLQEVGALDEPGKPSLLRALVDDYLREAPLHIGEIREAAAGPEIAGIAGKAHKLSGISLSVGACGVADVCIRIERIARTGSAAMLAPLVDQLEFRFAQTRAHLAALH